MQLLLFHCSIVSESLRPMDRSTPGLPVHHRLPKFAQVRGHCIGDAIQPAFSDALFSFCPQSFPASGTFPVSRLFTSDDQNNGNGDLGSNYSSAISQSVSQSSY